MELRISPGERSISLPSIPCAGPWLRAERSVFSQQAGLRRENGLRICATTGAALEEEARVRFSIASMFDISPAVRAENARAGLALPALSTELRASLSAALFHSFTVSGHTEEALEVEASAREAAYASTEPASWLRFELPESGLRYQELDFQRALDIINVAVRRDHNGREDARNRLSHILRSWILAALDRFDEALEGLEEGIAAAQQDRQNWAFRVFETTKGRQSLQMGDLAEAGAALRAALPWTRLT